MSPQFMFNMTKIFSTGFKYELWSGQTPIHPVPVNSAEGYGVTTSNMLDMDAVEVFR